MTSVQAQRRLPRCLAALAIVAAPVIAPTPAAAHNGVGALFKGRAGPYTVYAYDGDVLPHNAIEYRLVLLNHRSGDPANDIHVRVTATRPEAATQRASVNVYANVIFYNLPNPYPHDWQVAVDLAGRPGRGAVAFRVHGYQPTAPASTNPVDTETRNAHPSAAVIATAIALLAAAPAAHFLRRRRNTA